MCRLSAKFTLIILLAVTLAILGPGTLGITQDKNISSGIKIVELPEPNLLGAVTFESTLQERRSVRRYRESSVSLKSVSQLLWAAQGITSRKGFRTAPSAGALYPLEIFVAADKVAGLPKGIYRYLPSDHRLEFISEGSCSKQLSGAALRQEAIKQAPVVFVIAGVQKRTVGKYGSRGIRYMYIEAGHAAQNLCLQAVALDLGSLTIGAFNDHEVARILHMKKDEAPIYIIPAGRAR